MIPALVRLTILAAMTATPVLAADGPKWLRMPDTEAMAAAFPGVAQALEIEGRAVIACAVTPAGRVQACEVSSEAPSGLGFGQAALAISADFRLRPTKAADATVRIPIKFQVPPDELLARADGYRPPRSAEPQKALAREVMARVVPTDWLNAKVSAFVTQSLPMASSPGEDPQALSDARAAMEAAIAAGLPSMQEAAALELAAHRPAKVLQAALDAPPPDPKLFMDAQFKGISPNWSLAEVARIKADARARFCRPRGCGGGSTSAAPANKEQASGHVEHLSGVFFSNFEHATFFLCADDVARCPPGDANGYSLKCAGTVCDVLWAAVRDTAKPPDHTVRLRVALVGKRSVDVAQPKFLGDPGRWIAVERINEVSMIPPPS